MISLLSLSGLICLIFLSACIHEYPSGTGVFPDKVNATVEINFDLRWDDMVFLVENVSTRAREERPHRFILEVSQNEKIICRDTTYLSDEEFAFGTFNHKLSVPLSPRIYHIAGWYDMTDINHSASQFDVDDLREIKVNSTSIADEVTLQCAYGSDYLDLSEYNGQIGSSVTKELTLKHPGARFRLIATDISDFISNRMEDLLRGDTYRLKIDFETGNPGAFNIYSGKAIYEVDLPERTGDLLLPFGEYNELAIASGYLFCSPEDQIYMNLTVYNSFQMVVAKTPMFSFPVKRGFVTRVKGDFLTQPIDGAVSIDPKWEGEIIVDM